MKRPKIYTLLFYLIFITVVISCKTTSEKVDKNISYISTNKGFSLSENGKSTTIYLSNNDHVGVLKIAEIFQEDIERVTNVKPNLITNTQPSEGKAIIVGTIGKSEIIDKLIANNKIDVSSIKGKWETFLIQTVKNPFVGVEEALVIVGSDKRATIFGMFDVSEEIGVSPYYFWADVPVKKKENVFIARGSYSKGTPKVKYRGIFINDEAPALSGWANERFGGFNAKFYEHVFEYLLRLKANYIWPAMWSPRAFYADDDQNGVLANEYGIVMGTSHHEPLARAHAEWKAPFAKGHWNYNTNAQELEEFWKTGMQRAKNWESLITVGMRGDGDEAMSEGTATELLETIVAKQREIIKEVTGKPAEETPQIWALYKEVQDYYDKGMKVPDDVTLLLCDDNWGDLRKLPALDAKPRKGGYGIYYHVDYVGGPRNHKWLNTTQIEHIWDQMHLAYEHNVDKVWIVNVGDIKPMELPMGFFLDLAWDPEKWNANNLQDYYVQWSQQQFGAKYANEIADMLRKYTKYNARRKPELLNIPAYSLINFNEADIMVEEYNQLAKDAKALKAKLPIEYHDAFYQIVEHPIIACANLNELYIAAEKNRLYAQQGRASANKYAQKVKDLFQKDSLITKYYHEELAEGKWNHMMAQTHIGYRSWQNPRKNIIPKTVDVILGNNANFGVAVEGSSIAFPNDSINKIALPEFDAVNNQKYFIDIFNKGKNEPSYAIEKEDEWINIESGNEGRHYISINWKNIPEGRLKSKINITAQDGLAIPIDIVIAKINGNMKGFVEANGYISINADNFSDKFEPKNFKWKVVENLGKTSSSVISLPIKEGRVVLNKNSPKLSYNVHFQNKGKLKVYTYFSPTINYAYREGMYYGLSIDNDIPTQVNFDSDPWIFNYNGKVPSQWESDVAGSIKVITTEMEISEAGNHTLNYYRVDEGLVLQKIVIETGVNGIPKSYLGPPESTYIK